MSKVRMPIRPPFRAGASREAICASRATWQAPTTPPAGPERMQRTPLRRASARLMWPPFDCMTRKATPRSVEPPVARSRRPR